MKRLAAAGITTFAQLATDSRVHIAKLDDAVWARLRSQARLQIDSRGKHTPSYELAPPDEGVKLSLFLPRMMLAESPFRFLVIDDPLQAMDSHKVDGLARVLADVAKTRQVIVLTHDTRLLEATRRLTIDATVLEVERRAESVVGLHVVLDAGPKVCARPEPISVSDGRSREVSGWFSGRIRHQRERVSSRARSDNLLRTLASAHIGLRLACYCRIFSSGDLVQ